jgi:uncharacterized membrane protein
MPKLDGAESAEIDAPIDEVFAIAADVGRAPEWQGTMQSATVLESDAEGRPVLVETVADAKVAQVKVKLRFSYDPPTGMSWERVGGDLKSMRGSWTFEDLGGGRTRATYAMEGDPGFLLGQALRGPVLDQARKAIIGRPPAGLKRRAEGSG